MLGNKPAVDDVIAEARQLIDALFTRPKPEVTFSAAEEEEKETKDEIAFDLQKGGEENYDFMVHNRVSPETRDQFNDVIKQIMSVCPTLAEDTVETIVTVCANYMDIIEQLTRRHYGEEVSVRMSELFGEPAFELMIVLAKVFSGPDKMQQAESEVNHVLQQMMMFGSLSEKALGKLLSMLDGETKVFAFLGKRMANSQADYLQKHYAHMNPAGHIVMMTQINMATRIVSEVMCLLYERTANK